MSGVLFEKKKREMLRCPKCGSVVGEFGMVCDCSVSCSKCKEPIEVWANTEEVIVRRRRGTSPKIVPQE